MRTSRLHAAADVATRGVAVLTVAGLAGLAATISYQHMVLLARRHGVSGIDAHAFPICVDGLDLVLACWCYSPTGAATGPADNCPGSC